MQRTERRRTVNRAYPAGYWGPGRWTALTSWPSACSSIHSPAVPIVPAAEGVAFQAGMNNPQPKQLRFDPLDGGLWPSARFRYARGGFRETAATACLDPLDARRNSASRESDVLFGHLCREAGAL